MLVDLILPTFDRRFPLKMELSSLLAQTDGDWVATVVIDDFMYSNNVQEIAKIVEDFKDSRIQFMVTNERYNDWGHSPRELGKSVSKADYIIMTGDDCYYTPNFVAELKKATINKPGMVYWDMVHSHYDYSYFNCQPAYNQIDMGAFATRNDLAKQIKLNTSYAADGEFVRDFNIKFPQEQKIKINKVLFVHN